MLIRDNKKQTIVDRLQLAAINEIYIAAGLTPLELKDKNKPLHFSNISSSAGILEGDLPYKVSIIIPMFNAESTISVAIESLLAQTWHNLEIIAVDDCSTDATREVVQDLANRDVRVKLISKDVNEGAYPSRNRGLREASATILWCMTAMIGRIPKK